MAVYTFSKPVSVSDVINRISRSATVIGNEQRLVYGISSMEDAQPGSIRFFSSYGDDVVDKIKSSDAEVIILCKEKNELFNVYEKTRRQGCS